MFCTDNSNNWGRLSRACALIGLVFLATTAGAETLSFSRAAERLETDSEALHAARLEWDIAEAMLDEAKGKRWPDVGLSGRATRMDSSLDLDITPLKAAFGGQLPSKVPDRIEIQSRQFYNLSLNATLPLYTAGRITAGIDAAKAGSQAAAAAVLTRSGQLYETLVQRYFGQVLATEAMLVRQRTVKGFERHLKDTLLLEKEGLIARAERLRSNVALAEALRDLETANAQLALARNALVALLAGELPFELTTPIPPVPEPPDVEVMTALARDNNPVLAELRSRLDQAEAGVQAARGTYLPSVAAFGRRELYTNDLTLQDPEWAVGLAANWALFDGFQRSSIVRQRKAAAARIKALLADGTHQIQLLVRQRHQALTTAKARLTSFEATNELAEESLRAQRRAFEEGLASSLDVIDAELALSRVTLGELDARLEAWVALAGLYAAIGSSHQLTVLADPLPSNYSRNNPDRKSK